MNKQTLQTKSGDSERSRKSDISLDKTGETLSLLTPIEEYKGLLLKRDDKFILGLVNGGKLRQAIYLIEKNLEKIKKDYNSSVICSCSIKSPQSAIISEVCKKYGLTCNIVSYKTTLPNINLSIAQKNGANLYGSPSGYTSVIESRAKKINAFPINMGFESEEIIEANLDQVKNLPLDLDYLVVPVGSAMNFLSIIKGLIRFNIKPRKIIGIYVGKKPFKTLRKYVSNDILTSMDVTIIQSPHKYTDEVNIDNYFFDPIYEAKVYEWIMKNIDLERNKVLFWVIGKRNLEEPTEKIKWLDI